MSHNLPFHRSYWAVPDRLLAGCYPGDPDPDTMRDKLQGLVDAGVTRVINLMETQEVDRDGNPFAAYADLLCQLGLNVGRQIRCDRFSIRDCSVPSPELMREILQAIQGEMDGGGVLYVHCWGGKGRTGVVIGCHLVQALGMEADQALATIHALTAHAKEHFRPTPETLEQCAFVRSWKTTGFL